MEHNTDIHFFTPSHLGWSARNEILRHSKRSNENTRFIVDLSRTREIDAIGMGLLLQLLERADGDRNRVFLARAQGFVLEALKAAGIDKLAHLRYPE